MLHGTNGPAPTGLLPTPDVNQANSQLREVIYLLQHFDLEIPQLYLLYLFSFVPFSSSCNLIDCYILSNGVIVPLWRKLEHLAAEYVVSFESYNKFSVILIEL